MRTMKSYRFSEPTVSMLIELKNSFPHWSETEIVEKAIDILNAIDAQERNRVSFRSLSGSLWECSRFPTE